MAKDTKKLINDRINVLKIASKKLSLRISSLINRSVFIGVGIMPVC
jgi:hypothetical protein